MADSNIIFFTLEELCASSTAKARGINNFPTFMVARHLFLLGERILDPLRAAYGGAIRVTSGFRCPKLNSAIGGSATSVHLLGWAADLVPVNGDIDGFIAFTIDWVKKNRIHFDQLIDERDTKGNHWLHIALYGNHGEQRGQIMVKTKI